MANIESLIRKDKLKVLGSIIKINRINQNMSQQALSEGICVPSYLSKIENGEVIPSLDLINDIFNQLSIDYNDDYMFIKKTKDKLQEFFQELSSNGFIISGQIFKELESEENRLINSPLIVEYYIVKLAYYCGTDKREEYRIADNIIKSVEELLDTDQKHKYYFYSGIDIANIKKDYVEARRLLIESSKYKETGHLYAVLSTLDYRIHSYYDSLLNIDRALKFYYDDVNLINVALVYMHKGLLAFKLNSISTAINENIKAINYIKKINRDDLLIGALVSLCYYYVKAEQLEEAKGCIEELQSLNIDLNSNDSKLLVGIEGFYCLKVKDYERLNKLLMGDIFINSNNMKFLKDIFLYLIEENNISSEELSKAIIALINNVEGKVTIDLLIKEALKDILKEHYLKNRMYKQAYNIKCWERFKK